MALTPIPPYVPPYAPIPTVQPFTYRDGVTYWEKLNGFIKYLNRVIIPYVNEHVAELAEEFTTEVNKLIETVNDVIDADQELIDQKIADMQAQFDVVVQQIINDSIEVQDPVVAGIINDPNSEGRQALDAIYTSLIDFNNYKTEVSGDFVDVNTLITNNKSEIDSRIDGLEGFYDSIYANVKKYGAKGDGATDDRAAIQNVIDTFSRVYIPAGTFALSGALKIPSNRILVGAGIEQTTLLTLANVTTNTPVITNARNTGSSHTTEDRSIYIADLTLDGNAWNRGEVPIDPRTDASALVFACVNGATVERVRAMNGRLHCFDVSASVYKTDGLGYAPGPSTNIVFRNCVAENSVVDDGFTMHHSNNITFEGCRSTYSHAGDFSTQKTGFEIDEGSSYVTVRDCYASGWAMGFVAKGHEITQPAMGVIFDNCIAHGNAYGYRVEWDGVEPNINTRYLARDISIINCTSKNNVNNTGSATVDACFGISIVGYHNVTVDNFVSRDVASGGNIRITNDTSSLTIKNVMFDNVNIASTGAIRADINSSDIVIENINISGSSEFVAGVYIVGKPTNLIIDQLTYAGTVNPIMGNYGVYIGTGDYTQEIKNNYLTGTNGANTRFNDGSEGARTFVGQVDARYPISPANGGPWHHYNLPSGWTGEIYSMARQGVVQVRLVNVKPPSAQSSVITIASVDSGHGATSIVPFAVHGGAGGGGFAGNIKGDIYISSADIRWNSDTTADVSASAVFFQ